MFRKITKQATKAYQNQFANATRTSATYSSDVFSREKGIETYYRGHLVKFDYKDLYEINIETTDVFDQLHCDLNYEAEHDRAKYTDDIKPSFIHRLNDVVEIDWNDGTISKLNLNSLLEITGQKDGILEKFERKNKEVDYHENKDQNRALRKCYEDLISETVATVDLNLFNNSISDLCNKVASRSEPSNYLFTSCNFKKAIPETYNGLMLLQANQDAKLTFINGRILTKVYKFLYPMYFQQLVEQPALQYNTPGGCGFGNSNSFGSGDDEGWQTVITIKERCENASTSNQESIVDQIRFGDLDNNISSKTYYSAYNEFHRIKNDFIRHVNGTLKGRSDYAHQYELLNDAIIEVDVKKDQCLLVDTTCTWYAHEEITNSSVDSKRKLKVEQLKMSADHWKSSARSLGMRI